MAKKIQVNTVNMQSDVQVIFVNASLIAKVINAKIAMHNAFDGCVETEEQPVIDDKTGKPMQDETGKTVMETINTLELHYSDPHETYKAYEAATKLLDELTKAFEEA